LLNQCEFLKWEETIVEFACESLTIATRH